MDMGDTMVMGGAPTDSPLNASGIDFSNTTQASTFLGEILDDTQFQVDGNTHARYFWYGVCAVIGVATFFNTVQKITALTRIRAAAANRPRPASPSNAFSKAVATITAIYREASYPQFTPEGRLGKYFQVPPIGTIFFLVGYLAWVILLEFVNNDVEGAQHFTSLGVRAAWLGVGQMPLLILLAGKNNLIGLVTGVSYERLNVIHRWVSRVLFFLVTLHVIFLHLSWNAYGLMSLEYSTDSCIPTGWAVYVILIWMNLSTLAPFRNWSYEFFVVQHIITFFGFIIAVMFHLPSTALYSRVYIYIPIALYILDRGIRSLRFAWNNVRPGQATLTALDGGITKIRIQSKAINKWSPGAHVFLSIPKFGPGQSHPATIASVPSSHDGDLVFLLKGHQGFTSRLLKSATDTATSLLPTREPSGSSSTKVSHLALIDGPYGASHSDFAAFDTVLLISGSTGITFTLPILLGIASRATKGKLPVKRVVFLWVIKNTSWTSWISDELSYASKALREAGIELTIQVHVTCDNNFTTGDTDNDGYKECACECDKSLGPCCCISTSTSDGPTRAASSSSIDKVLEKTDEIKVEVETKSQNSIKSGTRSNSILPCADFVSGRPDICSLLWASLEKAEGETGVAVCGPRALNADVRRTVARCSDERGVHKGTGAEGIYLHAEGFGW
ncbi:hypothetical protein B7494_g3131 [Chlorociboria aeruginascens]|nr:hypothetical protein B7494_g3131 [Chlorociboria aeruginascens]